jgi:hypothetical protein
VTVTLSSKSLKPVVLPSNCMPATSAPPSMLMANDNEDDHKPAAKPNFISKTPTLSPLQRCQQLLRTRNARLKGKERSHAILILQVRKEDTLESPRSK